MDVYYKHKVLLDKLAYSGLVVFIIPDTNPSKYKSKWYTVPLYPVEILYP